MAAVDGGSFLAGVGVVGVLLHSMTADSTNDS